MNEVLIYKQVLHASITESNDKYENLSGFGLINKT